MKTNVRNTISMNELKKLILCNLQALWSEDNFLAPTSSKQAAMVPPLMIWGAPEQVNHAYPPGRVEQAAHQ